MNVTLEIKCPELASAINNLAAAIAGRTGETVVSVSSDLGDVLAEGQALAAKLAEHDAGKPKAARSAAKSSPKTEPSTGSTDEALEQPTPGETGQDQDSEESADTSGDIPPYDAVKKAIFNVSAKKGREAVIALLARFDVDTAAGQKADVIPETRWAEFIAEAEKAAAE